MFDRAQAAQAANPAASVPFPKVDAPQDSGIATITYYPIYGKLNLFDMGVAHFDVYTLAGYGRMNLKDNTGLKSSTDVITAGGGLAVWLSQHFATRFEVRYETYKDLISTENRRENTVQGMGTLSILL
jgi:outer membrane beta-barrel protein